MCHGLAANAALLAGTIVVEPDGRVYGGLFRTLVAQPIAAVRSSNSMIIWVILNKPHGL
jgi:hypothetical protein